MSHRITVIYLLHCLVGQESCGTGTANVTCYLFNLMTLNIDSIQYIQKLNLKYRG